MVGHVVPHEKYQKRLTAEINRARKAIMPWPRLIATTLPAVFVAILLLPNDLTAHFVDLPLSRQVPFIEFAYETPFSAQTVYTYSRVFLLFFFTAVGTVLALMLDQVMGRKLWPIYREITCPHCEGDIDIVTQWKCGNCGELNEDTPIYEKCRSGKEEPIGLVCPHCNNEVTWDVKAHEKAGQYGYGTEGVATDLLPGRRHLEI